MAQIRNKGKSITLYVKTKTGVDDFNRDVFSETAVTVDNVFIGVPETNEVLSELNLTGRRIAHILGIPKGDNHNWENVTVEFNGRKWKTFGVPIKGIPELMPFDWDMNVKVEAYE